MKIGAIIQARYTSSRLPGKVLFKLPGSGDKCMIEQIIARCQQSKVLNINVLATSEEPSDDKLADLAKNSINVYRGSLNNVLERYCKCAVYYNIDVIIRLTGDNPCIDATIIDDAVNYHIQNNNDYTLTEGLPIGTNLEIFDKKSLDYARQRATKQHQKEHVTPYFRENPTIFRIGIMKIPGFDDISDLRLTVDYSSDFALVSMIYSYLGDSFTLENIQALIEKYSWLKEINPNCQIQVAGSANDEIKFALSHLKKLNLRRAAEILEKHINEK